MKKTVIITGATDGVGKALAVLLSKDYNLALCGRSAEKMEQLVGQLGDCSVYAECFDIMDGAKRHAFCEKVEKEFGSIDVWSTMQVPIQRRIKLWISAWMTCGICLS